MKHKVCHIFVDETCQVGVVKNLNGSWNVIELREPRQLESNLRELFRSVPISADLASSIVSHHRRLGFESRHGHRCLCLPCSWDPGSGLRRIDRLSTFHYKEIQNVS